jgi:prolyl-tRNA editing enzyme YbaK/EbsC (Cys-tRNA(Pro) deacylase)
MAQCRIVHAVCRAEEGFAVTRKALNEAMEKAKAEGLRVKALLLTTPGNPLGDVMQRETMQTCADFCAENSLHVVYDCIYALSVLHGSTFVSPLTCSYTPAQLDRVHVIYGFAKDWGIAGYHVSALWSRSKQLNAAVQPMASHCPVSADTQVLLTSMLADKAFVGNYLGQYVGRLSWCCGKVCEMLRAAEIPFVQPAGGMYVWTDFSKFLSAPSWDAEALLFRRLFYDAHVLCLSGNFFHSPEPGWFRICYSNSPDFVLGVDRVISLVKSSKAAAQLGSVSLKLVDSLMKNLSAAPAAPAQAEPLAPFICLTPDTAPIPFERTLRMLDTLSAFAGKAEEGQVQLAELKRVSTACKALGLSTAQFVKVPQHYYDWELEQRRTVLAAPSVDWLCKSLIVANTSGTALDCSDPHNSRYYCVVVQYVAQISSQKIFKFVRSLNKDSRRDDFKFKMAEADEARRLTGFEFNAVCPVGMAVGLMPVILAAPIALLPWVWLGGGQVDLKLGCTVPQFIKVFNPFIADIYK